MNRRFTGSLAAFLIALAPAAVHADHHEKTNAAAGETAGAKAEAPVPDLATLAKLHAANLAEVHHGQMAAEKAKSPQVKAYGRRLVADHKAADRKLMAYCKKAKVDAEAVMREATAEVDKKKADPAMAKLHGLSGEEFDKEFATMMVDEHAKTIEFVTSTRDGAADPALKAMLTKLLPTLEKHRAQAQKLVEKLNKSS
jgi:putative membrane protein